MKLNVTVEKVLFENTEDGFTVMLVTDNDSSKFQQPFKAIANTVGISPSMTLILEGNWESNTKYGKTFKVEKWEEVLPDNVNGIRLYLESGLIKGIGPALAESIVWKFKEKTLDVINSHSEELLSIPKIGRKKAEQIWESWDEHKYMRESISYLLNSGISVALAVKIFKKYERNTINTIKTNPYQLIYDIEGIGFQRADDIAKKMGFSNDNPERIKAGITFVLRLDSEEGNTYMTVQDFLAKASQLLNVNWSLVNSVVNDLATNDDDRIVIVQDDKVYLPELYYAEKNIAYHLRVMTRRYSAFNGGKGADIPTIEEELGIKYEPEQIDAVQTALKSNVMVLTGGPGTGKTTVTKGIIRALLDYDYTIACAAPTGKAAERMSEATGMEAKTIHRLLEYKPNAGFSYNEQSPLDYDVIILDEASMINALLMNNFIKAVKYSTKLILIGDVDQLPSIGAGNVLNDIIASESIPVVKLEKIFRQAQSSRIITNAHKINHGIMPELTNTGSKDFFFIPATTPEAASETIIELVTKRLPKAYNTEPKQIQLLTPMKIGELGTVKMNNRLQAIINPTGKSLKYGATTFRVGDKVMQIKNNYDKDVFNGDTGIIFDIDEQLRIITVKYKNKEAFYEQKDFDELILAYASTIHKSQGSEYDIVVIPILGEHYVMLQRNLIYTAITRAKKICVLVGDKRMINYGVGKVTVDKRLTSLKDELSNKEYESKA